MKAFKIVAGILGVVILVIVVACVVIALRGIPSYDTKQVNVSIDHSEESVARGKKLTQMLCAGCHTDRSTGRLSGTKMLDAPPEFGAIYSANITKHKKQGIGSWTDGEIAYLLRTGIKKNGQYSPPYMAKLPLMSDEDIKSIIAFLRSDDRMVQSVDKPTIPSDPSFLTKALCNLAWKPFEYPSEPIPEPDTTDQVALGRYLSVNLDCFSCHSADFKTNDFLEPEKSRGYFAGGNKPLNLSGQVVLTANLTPDRETGIGLWTKEKFIKALKTGIKGNEPALQYPMNPYIQLSDYEAGAIYEYLQTIPAIRNKVERVIYD